MPTNGDEEIDNDPPGEQFDDDTSLYAIRATLYDPSDVIIDSQNIVIFVDGESFISSNESSEVR